MSSRENPEIPSDFAELPNRSRLILFQHASFAMLTFSFEFSSLIDWFFSLCVKYFNIFKERSKSFVDSSIKFHSNCRNFHAHQGFPGKFVEFRLMSQLSIFLEYLIFMQKFYFQTLFSAVKVHRFRLPINANNFTKVLSRKQILKLTFSGYDSLPTNFTRLHNFTRQIRSRLTLSGENLQFILRTRLTIDSNRGELNNSELFFTSSSNQIKNSCSCSRSANQTNENNAKANMSKEWNTDVEPNSLTETENSRSYYIIMRQYWWATTWCNMIFLYAAPH